jgi:fluoride exporter
MTTNSVPAAGFRYLAVALGSAIGGAARWLISEWLQGYPDTFVPWGTLFVNVTGSFLIGCYAALVIGHARGATVSTASLFVMTGLCGGYTTFSIFSLEVLDLIVAGASLPATFYVAGSLVAWLAAVWAGYTLVRLMRTHQARWGAAR